MPEEPVRERARRMPATAGIERVRHKTRIVDACKRNAIAGERDHGEFRVRNDLENALVFENRLDQIERLAKRRLRDVFAVEIELGLGAMRERNIGRVTRHDR